MDRWQKRTGDYKKKLNTSELYTHTTKYHHHLSPCVQDVRRSQQQQQQQQQWTNKYKINLPEQRPTLLDPDDLRRLLVDCQLMAVTVTSQLICFIMHLLLLPCWNVMYLFTTQLPILMISTIYHGRCKFLLLLIKIKYSKALYQEQYLKLF